jgi:N-acetylglucosamine kinase-like BadF-type ATPase
MRHFLGVDVGGTKTHALITDETGRVLGFGGGGPGNWEVVGYDGFTAVLRSSVGQAAREAGLDLAAISGAGFGVGGYDWPSQRGPHLDAIAPLGLGCPVEIVNDATLGILAGSAEGWGVSVVSGTGCNARGWSRDHKREGRAVGGMSQWSGEYAGGYDIIARAMRAVAFEWLRRGPATALTRVFLEHTGAANLDDLVEGVYLERYRFDPALVLRVFQTARDGDPQALEVIRWAGDELGGMAVGVINQLDLQQDAFDVVLIGSLFDGHPLMAETLTAAVQAIAPGARPVRLKAPPVVGAVMLGMEQAGLNGYGLREGLIRSTRGIMKAASAPTGR